MQELGDEMDDGSCSADNSADRARINGRVLDPTRKHAGHDRTKEGEGRDHS